MLSGKLRRKLYSAGSSLSEATSKHPRVCGETNAQRRACRRKEHPRVCRENRLVYIIERQPPGTLPRMRGKHSLSPFPRRLRRNTPAYAGKTDACEIPNSAAWEHPRVCGENVRRISAKVLSRGTPPRMRGKLSTEVPVIVVVRNTPAYAGKTDPRQSMRGEEKEHPRVCGENASRPACLPGETQF